MKFLKLALCAATASAALSGAAMAQEAPTFSFNVGATSDYSYRGLTQTAKDPAVFGGVDMSAGIFYAGAWASNVDWGIETDVYAGVKPTLGPVTFDLGVIYYGYPDSDIANAAFWEGKIAASIPAGPGSLGVAYYYSPEFFGDTGKADYWELNGSVPVGPATLGGAIGRQSLTVASYGVDGYTTMNAGVTFPIVGPVTGDVRYVYTDDDAKIACVGCSLNKVIFTVKASF
jgi:uncharacterized protein (TIGR02001 family)